MLLRAEPLSRRIPRARRMQIIIISINLLRGKSLQKDQSPRNDTNQRLVTNANYKIDLRLQAVVLHHVTLSRII
jgi:hypothetical protein